MNILLDIFSQLVLFYNCQQSTECMIMDQVYYTKLGEGRRVAIPAEVCEELGLHPGDPLAIKVREDGLQVVHYEQIVREVQAAFAPYKRPGISEVDALIQE